MEKVFNLDGNFTGRRTQYNSHRQGSGGQVNGSNRIWEARENIYSILKL